MIWTPDRIASAHRTFEKWHGTEHGEGKPIVGRRIDCVNFVTEILIDAGIAPRVAIPRMKNDGMFTKSDKLKNAFMRCLWVEQKPVEQSLPGDIAIFQTGMMDGHCGFVEMPHIWHCLAGAFVMRTEWRLWRLRVDCVLRIVKDGLKESPKGLK